MARLLAPFVVVVAFAAMASPAPAASPQVPQRCLGLPTVDGSDRGELLRGHARSERIFAFGGNDEVLANGGDDCVFGGSGANRLAGGAGDDTLEGRYGTGPHGGWGDSLLGGSGNDVLDGWDGNDVLEGGSGNDQIEGWSGNDVIEGGPGDDVISGGAGHDRIDAGVGNDTISSADGVAETVRCGTGRDVVRADPGDRLLGCERATRVREGPAPTARPRGAGGRRSTFVVGFVPISYGVYDVSMRTACSGVPPDALRQSVSVTTSDSTRVTLEFPAPQRGWCAGTYRGTVVRTAWPFDTAYPCSTRAEWKGPSKEYAGPITEDQCGRPASVVGGFSLRVKPGAPNYVPHPPCRPSPSDTVMETAAARVYTVKRDGYTFTYGCLFSVGRLVELGGPDGFGDSDRIDPLALAGSYAGYGYTYSGPADTHTLVVVMDLRTGKALYTLGAGGPDGDSMAGVGSLVMKPNGSVAWIGFGIRWDPAVQNNVQVRIAGKFDDGHFTELDRGDDLDFASMKLDGSTLSWTKGGQSRTATLN